MPDTPTCPLCGHPLELANISHATSVRPGRQTQRSAKPINEWRCTSSGRCDYKAAPHAYRAR